MFAGIQVYPVVCGPAATFLKARVEQVSVWFHMQMADKL